MEGKDGRRKKIGRKTHRRAEPGLVHSSDTRGIIFTPSTSFSILDRPAQGFSSSRHSDSQSSSERRLRTGTWWHSSHKPHATHFTPSSPRPPPKATRKVVNTTPDAQQHLHSCSSRRTNTITISLAAHFNGSSKFFTLAVLRISRL